VQVANQVDFDAKVAAAGDQAVLVQFVSPWCGHCAESKPKVLAAAKQLCGKATVLSVDATLNPKLADRFGIDGYPTVVMLRGGVEVTRLDGVEDTAEVLALVNGTPAKAPKAPKAKKG